MHDERCISVHAQEGRAEEQGRMLTATGVSPPVGIEA